MTIDDVEGELIGRNALLVHCSRPGRDGEFGPDKKPLYPQDLRDTSRDLQVGAVRKVCCSVIWPEHQETFGAVGIILAPRHLSEIHSMHTSDGGFSEEGGGMGVPPSPSALQRTFEASEGHNEWVLTGAHTIGIFVNLTMPLEVARQLPPPDNLEGEARLLFGTPVFAMPISIPEIAADFKGLPLLSFVGGALVQFLIGPDGVARSPISNPFADRRKSSVGARIPPSPNGH